VGRLNPGQTGGQDQTSQQEAGHFVTIELNLLGIHFVYTLLHEIQFFSTGHL
jgi:hypothetical protein